MRDDRELGFTLVEIVVAILVLTVGVLGLAGTSAMVTRMIGRGDHSAAAAQFAQQRFERLRASGCASQAAGADTLKRGNVVSAINAWTFTSAGGSTWLLKIITTYKTGGGRSRTDTLETGLSCLM